MQTRREAAMDAEDIEWVSYVEPPRFRLERDEDGEDTFIVVGVRFPDEVASRMENINRVQLIHDPTNVGQGNIREFSEPPQGSGFARTFNGRQKEALK
jgi:hypothetical protein